jgi:lactoylglutathione lyase
MAAKKKTAKKKATKRVRTKKGVTRKPAKRSAARRTPAKKSAPKRSAVPRFVERRRHDPESLRLRSAAPSFTVNDIQKSLRWYRDVLGFTVGERWEHEGQLRGVELLAGGVHFWLSQDDWKKGRVRVKGEGFRMHCETAQDVDAIAGRAKSHGGSLLEAPHDNPWGGRSFAVTDPDGFKITISTEA